MKTHLFKVDRLVKQCRINALVVFGATLISNGCATHSGQFDLWEARAEVENVVAEQVGTRAVFTWKGISVKLPLVPEHGFTGTCFGFFQRVSTGWYSGKLQW